MSFDPHALKIYIDGSCLKNPGGWGGFAARVECPFDWNRPDELIDYRGFIETNNQRMELQACIFAHDWVFDHAEELKVQRVQVITDSKYVYDGYRYSITWSQNDYRNLDGRPLKNQDLWKDLVRLRRKLAPIVRIEVKLIKGKTTEITKAVDRNAKDAALMPLHIDRGFQTGKVGRPKNNNKKAAKLYPAAGQEPIIRVYHSVAARRHEQIIKFQVYEEDKKDFFEKFQAYAAAEIGNELHRHHIYRVQMNDLPRYPRILEILLELAEEDLVARRASASP